MTESMTSYPDLMTLWDLRRLSYRALPLSDRWAAFLGAVPHTGQFTILLSGPSGTGKSTLAMDLALELARFGSLLYVCSEERIASGTLRKRARLLNVRGSRSRRIWMYDTIRLDAVKRMLSTGDYRFAIIDSIQEMDVANTELLELKAEFPAVIFVFVAQVDASEKRSRGSGRWPHLADIRLWTERDRDGSRWAVNVKNRYAPKEQRLFLFKPGGGVKEAEVPQTAMTYAQIVADHRRKGKRMWKVPQRAASSGTSRPLRMPQNDTDPLPCNGIPTERPIRRPAR